MEPASMTPVVLSEFERIAIIQTRAMMLKTDMRPLRGFQGSPSKCPIQLAVQEYDQGLIPFVLSRKRVKRGDKFALCAALLGNNQGGVLRAQ